MAGDGSDRIYGGDGDDTLWGGETGSKNDAPDTASDTIYGGAGDDGIVVGGTGFAYREAGDDTFEIEPGFLAAIAGVTLDGGAGVDFANSATSRSSRRSIWIKPDRPARSQSSMSSCSSWATSARGCSAGPRRTR